MRAFPPRRRSWCPSTPGNAGIVASWWSCCKPYWQQGGAPGAKARRPRSVGVDAQRRDGLVVEREVGVQLLLERGGSLPTATPPTRANRSCIPGCAGSASPPAPAAPRSRTAAPLAQAIRTRRTLHSPAAARRSPACPSGTASGWRRHADGTQLSRADIGQRLALEHQRRRAADDVRDRLRTALIRHADDPHLGHLLEKLAGHEGRRADAGMGAAELVRMRARVANQFSQRLDGQLGIDRESWGFPPAG